VQSFDARRALLRSNPSLYVSKTRLSVRRLPLFVSEKALRKLAMHALHLFESEVSDGTREGLNADELAVDEDDANAEVDESSKSKTKAKRGRKERGGPVKQAKIVRQNDRTDAVTGQARSKGYGFVEMQTHADALRVLRWANNNPSAMGQLEVFWKGELEALIALAGDKSEEAATRKKRASEALEALGAGKKNGGTLVVEFSIENVQVVQRRKTREGEAREKVPSRTLIWFITLISS
jgi:nucleolar protein 4